MKRFGKHRSPWIEVCLEVAFEETLMEVLSKGKTQSRRVVTPVFRLPNGTEFTGRRVGSDLRRMITRAAKLKGIVR